MSTLKTSLIVLIILIAGIAVASASISVKNIAITPTGDLVSGQTPPNPVTVSFVIDFNPTGGETFPSEQTLTMSTDLENGQWSYITSLDGNPNPAVTANGRNLNINGWVLSYPSKRELSMRVTLNGEVPTVTASGNKTIIRVAELSGKSEAIAASEVVRERYVINPADKTKAISDVKTASLHSGHQLMKRQSRELKQQQRWRNILLQILQFRMPRNPLHLQQPRPT